MGSWQVSLRADGGRSTMARAGLPCVDTLRVRILCVVGLAMFSVLGACGGESQLNSQTSEDPVSCADSAPGPSAPFARIGIDASGQLHLELRGVQARLPKGASDRTVIWTVSLTWKDCMQASRTSASPAGQPPGHVVVTLHPSHSVERLRALMDTVAWIAPQLREHILLCDESGCRKFECAPGSVADCPGPDGPGLLVVAAGARLPASGSAIPAAELAALYSHYRDSRPGTAVEPAALLVGPDAQISVEQLLNLVGEIAKSWPSSVKILVCPLAAEMVVVDQVPLLNR